MTTSPDYEFSASQNKLFQDLKKKMNLVGKFLSFIGFFLLFMGTNKVVSIFIKIFIKEEISITTISITTISSGINNIIEGIFFSLIGIWTRKAALSFSRIAKTTNNNIENLMAAMVEFHKLYTLQYVLVTITILFLIFAIILGLIILYLIAFF